MSDLARHVAPIVLVEDDANDVLFVRRALERGRISNALLVYGNAAAALKAWSFLRKPVTEDAMVRAVQALGFVVVTSVASGLGFRIIERRCPPAAASGRVVARRLWKTKCV